jgi:hypothetical protein
MIDTLMLFLIVLVNFSMVAILIRLNVKHRDFFTKMQFIFYGSSDKTTNIVDFFLERKYVELNDRLLTALCNLFIVLFLISLPMMFITVMFRK